MFFVDILVKSKTLGRAWRVAYNQNDDHSSDTCLPEICGDLDRWIGSENMDPRRRLSLRTSAVLVNGAAKDYKQEVEELYREVEEMMTRGTISDETADDSSGYPQQSTPEQSMRQSEWPSDKFPAIKTVDRPRRKSSLEMSHLDCSLSSMIQKCNLQSSQDTDETDREGAKSRKRKKYDDQSTSSIYPKSSSSRSTQCSIRLKSKETDAGSSARSSTRRSSSKQLRSDRSNVTESDTSLNTGPDLNKSFVEISGENDANSVERRCDSTASGQSVILRCSTGRRQVGECSKRKTKTMDSGTFRTRSLGVQAGFIALSQLLGNAECNKNLPYGVLLIYDNNAVDASVPSKVVVSSLNPDVRNLF